MPERKNIERQLVKQFVQFLRESKGYPDVVLKTFFLVDTKERPPIEIDLVIPDQHRAGFTAVFEFKRDPNMLKSKEARQQLLQYVLALGNVRRAAYLVCPGESKERQFKIYQVFDEDRFEEVFEENFPSHDQLIMGPASRRP
jgi:hypothetical protein